MPIENIVNDEDVSKIAVPQLNKLYSGAKHYVSHALNSMSFPRISLRKGAALFSLTMILTLSACSGFQPEGYFEYDITGCNPKDAKIAEVQNKYNLNLDFSNIPKDLPPGTDCVLTVRTINNDKDHTPLAEPYVTLSAKQDTKYHKDDFLHP
jgi:hypothetical protein